MALWASDDIEYLDKSLQWPSRRSEYALPTSKGHVLFEEVPGP